MTLTIPSWQATATGIYEKLMLREFNKPDIVTYNTMLSLYLHPSSKKNNDIPRAMRIYESIHESGLTPDSLTFLGVLRGCNLEANSSVAWRVWRDICAVKLTPGAVLVSLLLRSFRYDMEDFEKISRELAAAGISIPVGHDSIMGMRKASLFVDVQKVGVRQESRS